MSSLHILKNPLFCPRFLKATKAPPHYDERQLCLLLEEDNLKGELSCIQRDSLELEVERSSSSADLTGSLVVHNLIRRALDGRPPLTARVIRHLRLGLSGVGSRNSPMVALLQAQLMKVLSHSSLKVS